MAIGNAVERGSMVYIYNEKGQFTATVSVGAPPPSGLKGYASSVVNIRRMDMIYSYNERGQLIGTVSAV